MSNSNWKPVSTQQPAEERVRRRPNSSLNKFPLYAKAGHKNTPELDAGFEEIVCPIAFKMHVTSSDFTKEGDAKFATKRYALAEHECH